MKQKLYTSFLTIILSFIFFSANANSLEENKAQYKALSEQIIQEINSKNLSNTQNNLNDLTNIGVAIANNVAESNPNGKELLTFLTQNINTIKSQNIEAIESNWHEGKAFPANANHDSFDHHSAVSTAKEAVVHPLTALVALQEYQKTKNPDFLKTAKFEINEVLDHLGNLR